MIRSTFSGIDIGRKALQAHRLALDVTGHNIANANSPGYSRQVARLAATNPYTVPAFNAPSGPGQIGTGVHVSHILRMRDQFVQAQINAETQTQGYWETRQQILEELELTFLEPSDVGLRHALDQFWESLQELSKTPESQATRAVVRERAIVLAETIRSIYEQFHPLQKSLDAEIQTKTMQINSLATQIATLNNEIRSVIASENVPNDLFDRRDLLLEQMARLADIQVVDRHYGMISVSIGGVTIVDGHQSRTVAAVDTDGDDFVELWWEGTNKPVTLRAGELKALIEGRDTLVPAYIDEVNEFARVLIEEVNRIHRQGYGLNEVFDPADPANNPPPAPPGRDFFAADPHAMINPAETLALHADILADAGNIAASLTGAVGDGSNATRLAQLKQSRIYLEGTASPNDFLGSLVAGLGVHTQQAVRMVDHQVTLIGHLERLRDSVSGVSLDEELSNMIQFQHAYAAAARVVTTMDEAIETIIHRMGMVGR